MHIWRTDQITKILVLFDIFPSIDGYEKSDSSHILINFATVKNYQTSFIFCATRWTAINEQSTLF